MSVEDCQFLKPWLKKQLNKLGLIKFTPIQMNCIPQILYGKDCIGAAKTGSGKTFAFALPILERLSEDPVHNFALVLTPTHELAYQISEQFLVSGRSMGIKVCVVAGGTDQMLESQRLMSRPHVIVAMPGKFEEMSWKPVDLNDFEKELVSQNPTKEYCFKVEEDNNKHEDSMTAQKISEREDRNHFRLSMLAKLHESNVIPKVPGRLLNHEDLLKSDPASEAIRMMRSLGMQPHLNARLSSSQTIASRNMPPVVFDRNRNMRIFLDNKYFELKLRKKKKEDPEDCKRNPGN